MQPTVNVTREAEAKAVAEIMKKSTEPQILDVEVDGLKTKILITQSPHGGHETTDLRKWVEHFRPAPERRRGTATLTELASFIAHAKRFADKDSAIFATRTPASLTCVFDYHRAGHESAPRHGQHRAHYAFPLADEWQAWTLAHGKRKDQAEFCEFIEARLLDVLEPSAVGDNAKDFAKRYGVEFASPQRLMELSRGLHVKIGHAVKQHLNPGTGEASLIFETQHMNEQGAPLRVPNAFVLAIPVFRGGARFQIPCRLRYRVAEQRISWFVEIARADVAFDVAFSEACKKAADETGLPLFFGTAEG